MFVIDSVVPDHVPATATADARLGWTGEDDRGIELEMVALDLDDAIVVVHVMPTALRRREGEQQTHEVPTRPRRGGSRGAVRQQGTLDR